MLPTDIRNPDDFLKVVDCQWAGPAHTPGPEYIRLIAAGRHADAYMVSWHSNLLTGILGCTCDRPCDSACRRGRVEEQLVAIDWLSSVSFGHITAIGKRVIVRGGGHTAMDGCRSARRLGGEDVTVILRCGFAEMKALP